MWFSLFYLRKGRPSVEKERMSHLHISHQLSAFPASLLSTITEAFPPRGTDLSLWGLLSICSSFMVGPALQNAALTAQLTLMYNSQKPHFNSPQEPGLLFPQQALLDFEVPTLSLSKVVKTRDSLCRWTVIRLGISIIWKILFSFSGSKAPGEAVSRPERIGLLVWLSLSKGCVVNKRKTKAKKYTHHLWSLTVLPH